MKKIAFPRQKIFVLSKEGYSEQEISAKMRCIEAAVYRVVANFNNYRSCKDLNRSGKPMEASPEII